MTVLAKLPTSEQVHRLATRVRKAREETKKVQLELNLQIAELRLKEQLSTPPEVKNQCTHTIQMGLEQIIQVTQCCTRMLEQALTILTHLQEDPNL